VLPKCDRLGLNRFGLEYALVVLVYFPCGNIIQFACQSRKC